VRDRDEERDIYDYRVHSLYSNAILFYAVYVSYMLSAPYLLKFFLCCFIITITLQWSYQVSAVYSGSYDVETIRTTWQGSASLRNSASITLGISQSGGNAGASSSWQTVSTVAKYWENSNGSKTSDYSSNMVVTPAIDYRSSTIGLINTARVKLKADAKPYEISASV
jgi:hypothetical protein